MKQEEQNQSPAFSNELKLARLSVPLGIESSEFIFIVKRYDSL